MRHNSFLGFLRHPLRTIWKLTYGEQGNWVAEQGPGKLFLAVVFFPLILLMQFVFFMLFTWTVSRNGRAFLYGAPALVLVSLALAAVFVFQFFSDRVCNRYRIVFVEALNAKDYESAHLWNDKVLSFDPNDSEYRYASASMVSEEKNPKQALGLMLALAPIDDPEDFGNLDAHLWCARFYMSQEAIDAGSRLERGAIARNHLLRAKEILKDKKYQARLLEKNFDARTVSAHVETYFRLGKIYELEEDLSLAITMYEEAARFNMNIYPVLLRLRKELHGDEDELFRNAQRDAIDKIQAATLSQPNNISVWQSLVACHLLSDGDSNRYVNAEKQIGRARNMVTNIQVSRQLVQLRSDLFVHAVDNFDFRGTDQQQFARQIEFLTKALTIMPRNRAAIRKMIEMIEPPDGPLSDQQIDWLRDYVIDNEASFVAYIMLGMDAALKSMDSLNINGKADAILQWRLATSQDRNAKEILTATANLMSIAEEQAESENSIDQDKLDPEKIDSDNIDPGKIDPDKIGQKSDPTPKQDKAKTGSKSSKQKNGKRDPLAIDQQNPSSVYTVELTDYQIGNTKKAVRLMDLAIEMEPEEVQFLEMRGVLLFRLKEYANAYDDLQTAYEMDGSRIIVIQFLVLCAEEMGQKDDLKIYQDRLDQITNAIRDRRNLRNPDF